MYFLKRITYANKIAKFFRQVSFKMLKFNYLLKVQIKVIHLHFKINKANFDKFLSGVGRLLEVNAGEAYLINIL